MSKWKEVKVSDVVEIIGGGTPKTTNLEFWDGNIPWLSIEDFNNDDRFVSKTVKTITDKGLEQSSTKLLNKGDLIISARGTVGKLAQLDKPMAFNQSCYGLRGKSQIINNGYLYYALKTAICSLQNAGHGTVFNTITRDTFEIVSIPVPSQDVQDEIENILGSLDQKIELNQRMSETLEGMARSIFKSWFVDFDPVHAKAEGRPPEGVDEQTAALFPDSFNDEGIPVGWINSTIGDEVIVCGGSTPSTKEPSFWSGNIHWTSPKDLSSLSHPVLLDTDRKITKAGLEKITSGLLPRGTVLMSSRAPIGYLAIAEVPVAINQGYIAMIANKKLSNVYVWLWTQEKMDVIESFANGSTFQEISKKNFKPIEVCVPSVEVMNAFNDIINPLYEKIVNNVFENQTLETLRDTLLPKLISGDLRVEDTATHLKEAV